jgi:hypothetical protein
MAVAANQTPVLNHHCKHNPTAEVTDLLKLEVQFLVGPEPLLKEATYRRSTLEANQTPVQDHIFGDAAHHPVEITAIESLNLLAHKLNQVGRRGLLGHLPASIPDGQTRTLTETGEARAGEASGRSRPPELPLPLPPHQHEGLSRRRGAAQTRRASGFSEEADDGSRTRDLRLGKPTLYQLSYVRVSRAV